MNRKDDGHEPDADVRAFLAAWDAPPPDPAARRAMSRALRIALHMDYARRRWRFAWRASARAIGLLLLGGSGVLAFAFALLDAAGVIGADGVMRLGLELLLPMLFGLCAALLFAPEDEPTLELLLTAPRPMRWIIYERGLTLIGIAGAIGGGASLWLALTGQVDFWMHLLRWLPPAVGVGGLAAFASLWGRRSSYGVLLVIVLCAGMAIGGETLLVRFPSLWALVIYPAPGAFTPEQYAINRALLCVIGAVCAALVVWRMGDSEVLLGTGDERR
jgi:hypothetical protein